MRRSGAELRRVERPDEVPSESSRADLLHSDVSEPTEEARETVDVRRELTASSLRGFEQALSKLTMELDVVGRLKPYDRLSVPNAAPLVPTWILAQEGGTLPSIERTSPLQRFVRSLRGESRTQTLHYLHRLSARALQTIPTIEFLRSNPSLQEDLVSPDDLVPLRAEHILLLIQSKSVPRLVASLKAAREGIEQLKLTYHEDEGTLSTLEDEQATLNTVRTAIERHT